MDGAEETDGGRGREVETEEEEEEEGKIFPHLDYFRPFQSRLKNNFGRGDCLCHTFTVSRIERASAVFNLTQLSQNKPTCYIRHYLKNIA